MKTEKFINDTTTVLKFIQIYCDSKHEEAKKEPDFLDLEYKGKPLHVRLDFTLCATCKQTFLYSYERLQECPQDPKPRCRKCPNPCYERSQWKHLAKIMRFSGMKLGLVKLKKFIKIPSKS